MPCESRVVIFRDKQGRITRTELVCDGVCSGGRCQKVQVDDRPATDEELERHGITKREGYRYRTFVEKCACRDGEGHVRPPAAGELERCCQITLRHFSEGPVPEKPAPGELYVLSYYFVVKTLIACEKRDGADCAQCTCERFRVRDSVHEVVDENGEVTGTAESVICRCL